MIDAFPFGIAFSWEKDGEPTTTVLFERNGPIPSTKLLTFYRYAVHEQAAVQASILLCSHTEACLSHVVECLTNFARLQILSVQRCLLKNL